MNAPRSTSRGQVQPVVAIVLTVIAVVGVMAAGLASRPVAPAAPVATDRPTSPPVATPSVAPTKAPTVPSPSPSTGPLSIDLENATGHDVSILVHDETGTVAGGISGTPGDGMSVRWHDAIVKSVSARSIAITWAGLPGDDLVDLGIALDKGTYHLTLVQAGPVPYSDAMGEDRVLVLTLDGPVVAKDVSIEVLDRTVD
jgi:hypothetical protein